MELWTPGLRSPEWQMLVLLGSQDHLPKDAQSSACRELEGPRGAVGQERPVKMGIGWCLALLEVLEKVWTPEGTLGSSGSETGMVKETTVLLLEPLKRRVNRSQDEPRWEWITAGGQGARSSGRYDGVLKVSSWADSYQSAANFCFVFIFYLDEKLPIFVLWQNKQNCAIHNLCELCCVFLYGSGMFLSWLSSLFEGLEECTLSSPLN